MKAADKVAAMKEEVMKVVAMGEEALKQVSGRTLLLLTW